MNAKTHIIKKNRSSFGRSKITKVARRLIIQCKENNIFILNSKIGKFYEVMEFHGKVELAPNKQSTCQEQRAYKKRRSKKPISNKVFVFLSISEKKCRPKFLYFVFTWTWGKTILSRDVRVWWYSNGSSYILQKTVLNFIFKRCLLATNYHNIPAQVVRYKIDTPLLTHFS